MLSWWTDMHLVFYILLSVMIPLVLFYGSFKIKKTYLNVPVYFVLAAIVLLRNIFYIDFYNKQFPNYEEVLERINSFLSNDSVILLVYFIIPGCITCIAVNIVYYFKQKKNKV